MISAWTKHLSEEERPQFERSVQASKPVLERLQTLLSQEIAGLEQAEMSPKIYDLPNWDYRQAHGNGFKAALKLVDKIINLDQGI